MTNAAIIEMYNELLDRINIIVKDYPFIKDCVINFEGMGEYIVEIKVKESDYVMDSLLPNSLVKRLNEEFKFANLNILRFNINLIE